MTTNPYFYYIAAAYGIAATGMLGLLFFSLREARLVRKHLERLNAGRHEAEE